MVTSTYALTAWRTTVLVAATTVMAACGGRRLAVIAPMGDAAGAAVALRDRTVIEERLWIDFSWELNESGQRVGGLGVARIEPPYKARLDLFLGNGETVLSAALVDGELRLSYGAPEDILPPADLMWAVLGVFRRPEGTRFLGGDLLEGGATRLRYAYSDGTELHYQARGGLLRKLELLDGERVVQWVEVALEEEGRYPMQATYRNVPAFRELKVTREALERVGPFDPDIWDPIG